MQTTPTRESWRNESPEELIDRVAKIGAGLYAEPNRYKQLIGLVRTTGSSRI